MKLRCDRSGVLFGIADEATGTLEVACRGKRCGHGPGIVVIHRFDLSNGKVLKTMRFSDPAKLFSHTTAKKGA